MRIEFTYAIFTGIVLLACASDDVSSDNSRPPAQSGNEAEVAQVAVSGQPSAYQFSVTINSPDTGCDQYADWWEVVSEEGELIYRRVLLHSHVDEQPFTRSGGAVVIEDDETVWVRVHMNPIGYSTQAMKGTVNRGFVAMQTPNGFAENLSSEEPLPSGCNF